MQHQIGQGKNTVFGYFAIVARRGIVICRRTPFGAKVTAFCVNASKVPSLMFRRIFITSRSSGHQRYFMVACCAILSNHKISLVPSKLRFAVPLNFDVIVRYFIYFIINKDQYGA